MQFEVQFKSDKPSGQQKIVWISVSKQQDLYQICKAIQNQSGYRAPATPNYSVPSPVLTYSQKTNDDEIRKICK